MATKQKRSKKMKLSKGHYDAISHFSSLLTSPLSTGEDNLPVVAGNASDHASDHMLSNLDSVGGSDAKTKNYPNVTRGEYLRGKKIPQCQFLGDCLVDLVSSSSDPSTPVTILDIGGGRGDLTSYLLSRLSSLAPSAIAIIIDINVTSLEAGVDLAESLGVRDRVLFMLGDVFHLDVGDFSSMSHFRRPSSLAPPVPISELLLSTTHVVALHACGRLSDIAMDWAIKADAEFIVVPCCFTKFQTPNTFLNWSSTAKAKSPNLSPEDFTTFRTLLLRICEANDSANRPTSFKAMSIVNSLRIEHLTSSDVANSGKSFDVDVRYFPKTASMKNAVIIRQRLP